PTPVLPLGAAWYDDDGPRRVDSFSAPQTCLRGRRLGPTSMWRSEPWPTRLGGLAGDSHPALTILVIPSLVKANEVVVPCAPGTYRVQASKVLTNILVTAQEDDSVQWRHGRQNNTRPFAPVRV